MRKNERVKAVKNTWDLICFKIHLASNDPSPMYIYKMEAIWPFISRVCLAGY